MPASRLTTRPAVRHRVVAEQRGAWIDGRATSGGVDVKPPADWELVAAPSSDTGRRAKDMTTPTEFSITWRQALAWRLQRQLLDPVGSEPVGDVVRRLGAVLSMDASL